MGTSSTDTSKRTTMTEIETINYLKQWAANRAVELSGDPDAVDFEVDKNAKAIAEEFREWILPTEDIEYIALEDQTWAEEYDPNEC